MARRSSQERAARKRAERKKRRKSGSGEAGSGGGGGMMSGMRSGFRSAVHGKQSKKGKRSLGWLPIVLVVVALIVLIRRLGIF